MFYHGELVVRKFYCCEASWRAGAEFQLALHPWGIAHSNYTRSSLESIYWVRATMAAFMESRRQWQQPVAVEFSFSDGGLGPWHGDMTPFGVCFMLHLHAGTTTYSALRGLNCAAVLHRTKVGLLGRAVRWRACAVLKLRLGTSGC